MGRYTASTIKRKMAEAKDLTSKAPAPTGVPLNVPEDKSVNTLGRYGSYKSPASMAKKAKKKKKSQRPKLMKGY